MKTIEYTLYISDKITSPVLNTELKHSENPELSPRCFEGLTIVCSDGNYSGEITFQWFKELNQRKLQFHQTLSPCNYEQ